MILLRQDGPQSAGPTHKMGFSGVYSLYAALRLLRFVGLSQRASSFAFILPAHLLVYFARVITRQPFVFQTSTGNDKATRRIGDLGTAKHVVIGSNPTITVDQGLATAHTVNSMESRLRMTALSEITGQKRSSLLTHGVVAHTCLALAIISPSIPRIIRLLGPLTSHPWLPSSTL